MRRRRSRSRAQTLDDADDQRAADAPLVAQGEFEECGESFGEQGGAGLAHDDGGKRASEQPEAVEQTFKTGGHAFEQSQRGGANDVPAPEDDAGCNGENSSDDDIDNAPLVISLGHSFSMMCLSSLLTQTTAACTIGSGTGK